MRIAKSSILEALEPRALFASVAPTPFEQYAVELINRARANPTAETQRLIGYGGNSQDSGDGYNGDLNEGVPSDKTITADPKQPLAINTILTAAARNHSAWMVANSTFDHAGVNGSNAYQRILAEGYTFVGGRNWGENIAINWASSALDPTATALEQQNNLFTDLTIDQRGHRTNMMEASRNEIGLGFASGPYNYPGYGSLQSLAATHDTASNGRLFLTGVAYTDAVSDDDFYTPGEGLGNVAVTAVRQGDGLRFTTSTWASGGYSLELPAGTYDVSGTGDGLVTSVYYHDVTVADRNVKRDFVTGNGGDGPAVPTDFAVLRGTTLIVTGTGANDVIGIANANGEFMAGMNGGLVRYASSLVDSVAVLAGDGNDRVVINDGVLRAYVEGGNGKDTLIGGSGNDTLYGNASIDRIEGNGGDDLLVGENGSDVIFGGSGRDRIYGGFGNDVIEAGSGNDRVWGGVGDDLILGGRGRDYLYGEQGVDTLNGGTQDDTAPLDEDDTRIAIEVLV